MKHTQIKFGSHTIAATIAGPVTSQTFILIHGIGMSSRYFRPLMTELSQHFRVAAIDLPGFGFSSRPPQALSIPELAGVVAGLIAQQHWTRPILVGQSMGCQIVRELTRQHPRLARRAVFISPTTNDRERTAWQQAFRLVQDTFREPLSVLTISWGDYLHCGIPRYLTTLRYMLQNHIEDGLPTCRAEVLIIRGTRDRIVPHEWALKLTNLLPFARLAEIKRAPHLVQWTNAPEIARLCRGLAGRP